MKKIILLSLAFAVMQVNAQSTAGKSQYSKEKATKEEKQPVYKTWAVGVDVGNSFSLMDLYSSEAGKNSLWEDYGRFDVGVSVKLEKWVSSFLGWQGQLGYAKMSGSKKEYAFTSPLYRMNFSALLNFNGIGGRNKTRQRKHAWIMHLGVGTSWSTQDMYTFHDPDNPNVPLSEPMYLYTLTGDGTAHLIDGETSESYSNHSYFNTGLEWRYRFAEYWDLKIGTQFIGFFSDNVDGSRTLESTEPNVREAVPSYFPNVTNDVSMYTSIGVNWYFGGKKVKGQDVIIYTNPLTSLERRVGELESQMEELLADVDGDHVSDYWDQDTQTPEGYIVDGAGVALDIDRDGVPDYADEDPFSTPGASVDTLTGREYDQDNDGVPDSRDMEPNTPQGMLVNYQGKTVVDNIGGGASGNDSYFLPSVYFDFNKSLVSKANYQRMAVVANYMRANPNVSIDVVGHTDPVGTEAYNQNLSERRAKAVIKALVNDFDIDESKLNLVPKGEAELISKRNDINRRVEFRIK